MIDESTVCARKKAIATKAFTPFPSENLGAIGRDEQKVFRSGPTRKNQGNCLTDRGLFRFCAESISLAAGSPWAFALSLLIVVGWILTGPLFHYSDTWQLVINTATTIVTFLMVFLIQNTQNRDTKAIQLKLDELLRGVRGARTAWSISNT